MSPRYVAIVGTDCERLRAILHRASGLRIVLNFPTILLACHESADRIDLGDTRGTIIGTLFDRLTNRLLSQLSDAEIRDCLQTRGASLFKRYWGNYVAVLTDEGGTVTLMRDPSGAIPCYVWKSATGRVITSDVRVCTALGLIPSEIDWQAVAAHLLWPDRRACRTCVRGVSELVAGSRLEAGEDGSRIDAAWVPWHFTSGDRQIDDAGDAADAVRSSVLGSVGAWCDRYARPLVSLSGGLDSSLVMACAKRPIAAVTLMTHEALGDERKYAKAVSDWRSVPLIEARKVVDAVDPKRSNAASLPRPVSRLFAQELDRIWAETVSVTGADALYHGGGGDNVFCYLASSTPYLDAVLTAQPSRTRRAVLASLSRMTNVSGWRIRRAAFRKALERGRYRWPRDPRLLTREAIRIAGRLEPHPWFEKMPAWTLPGKQAHVAALLGIQNYLEAVVPPQHVPVIAPLMSQPVVETCLQIPTWLWCRDGMNRVVARDAFRDQLPAIIIDRRTKGSPVAFGAQMVAAKRRTIRELLGDGHLAAKRLIDIDAVDQALGSEGPLRGNTYLRVAALVDVEAWLQTWIGTSLSFPRAHN